MPELDEQAGGKKDQVVPTCILLLRRRQEGIEESPTYLEAATELDQSVGAAIRGFCLLTAHYDELWPNSPMVSVTGSKGRAGPPVEDLHALLARWNCLWPGWGHTGRLSSRCMLGSRP